MRRRSIRAIPFGGARRRTWPRMAGTLIILFLLAVVVELGRDLAEAWRHRRSSGAEADLQISYFGIKACGAGLTGRLRSTCIVDGDTGWEGGVKWRLRDIDTPELTDPGCTAERVLAERARDRLVALMGQGYRIQWSSQEDRFGRKLVTIRLRGGRSASDVLVSEGLARRPSSPKAWCS